MVEKKTKKTSTVKKSAVAKGVAVKVTKTTDVRVKKTGRKRAVEEAMVETMVHCMQEKKGQRVVALDLRKVSGASFDFFVICEVDSAPQARAIADEIDEKVYVAFGEEPLHTEGYANGEWVLLDYGGILAHIFDKETRRHYRLEELWGDADLRVFEEEEN